MNCGKRGKPPGLVVNCAYVQGVIDDLLHELGQPLTALRCSLDLALRKKGTAEQLREAVTQAVVLTDRLLKITAAERNLMEADNAGMAVRMDLSQAVRAVADDFEPVVDSSGTAMCVAASEPEFICADPGRISRALFAAVDLALYRLPEQKTLLLAVVCTGPDVVCYIGEDRAPLPGKISSMDLRAFEPGGAAEFVARMVGAAGGSAWEVFMHNYTAFMFRFPTAPSVSDVIAKTLAF